MKDGGGGNHVFKYHSDTLIQKQYISFLFCFQISYFLKLRVLFRHKGYFFTCFSCDQKLKGSFSLWDFNLVL